MHRYTIATSLVLSAAVLSGACKRDRDKMATTDVQTESAQPANTPTTVEGCLKAGDAADTYVLTTARTEGSAEASTYQLVGEQTASLREHLGHRVQITGTVQAEQEVAGRTTARPDEERPTGTSGTPTVRTRSEINIRRLSVNSVKLVADRCET